VCAWQPPIAKFLHRGFNYTRALSAALFLIAISSSPLLFGGSQIIVAYEAGGKSLGDNGFARIVVPGHKAGGRFVSNIAKIEMRDAGK
jgi:hypothetical protein